MERGREQSDVTVEKPNIHFLKGQEIRLPGRLFWILDTM